VLHVRLHTNQRGLTRDTQRWWWEIRDFQNNSWVELGDNTDAENWRWAYRVFTISLPAGQVINAGSVLQVRYQTDADMDMSAIDYMVIELVTTSVSGHFVFVPVVHREPSSAHTPTVSPSPSATATPSTAPTATSTPTSTPTKTPTPTPTPSTTPPPSVACSFNPTSGLVFATSMEHPYWHQLANCGNSASVLAPYLPNRVYYSYPNHVTVTTSIARMGVRAQQFQNISGTHEPQFSFKYALPRSDVYYWRFYRQYEAGYQFTCESKAFVIHGHNPITNVLPAGQRPNGDDETHCFLNQPTGYGEKFRQNIGTPTYITSGQWIDFQMMMKLNTPGQADGEIKLWINGDLKMHHQGIAFRTVPQLQLNAVSLTSYIGGHCTSARNQRIWDDHYMVSKTFITDSTFNHMCETKTEWFDTGVLYQWDLARQCWPGVNCPP
jgi:hypothetical protein